jgi:hypothetical protein
VDAIHYNEKYNGLIAQAIAERIAGDNDIGVKGKIASQQSLAQRRR